MATLINGNGNTPVTAQQDADLFQGIFGGSGVKMLGVGSEMAYTIEDANTITLADGECIDSEGRRIHIDVGYEDTFTIPTGTSGTTAYYIIGYYISTDSSGNETASTFVTKMSSSTATISEGSLRDGDSSKYVSLYRVTQSGLTIESVEALYTSATPLSNIADVIEETLPFSFGINGSSYGYYTTSGTFVSFRSPTGNATTARVLSGYTFSNASNDGLTGTMNNWGANSVSLSSNTATLSAGYYSSITINAVSRYTAGYNAAKVGNATAARVLNGYTFTNSSNVGATGSMNNWGSNTVNMTANTKTLSAGYYSSISINAASRYTAGYNARSITTTLIGNFNSSANLNASSPGIASNTTFNVASKISSYANLSASNLYVANVVAGVWLQTGSSATNAITHATGNAIRISYNASNGIATVTGLCPATVTSDNQYTARSFTNSFSLMAKYLA